MSILTELLHKQITWDQAKQKAEGWAQQIAHSVASDPALVATAGAVASELKQAASDAITTADTLAGPILAAGGASIEAAADAAFAAYFGPFAPIANKATHDSVDRITTGLKAFLDAKAAEFKANMGAPSAPAAN